MKRLSIMLLSAGLAGPAMAGLVIDGGQTPMFLPNNNDFKADLNGIGLDSVYDGGADILATQTGVVQFYYHAAESSNDNQFVVDGTILGNDLTPGTVLKTEAGEAWSNPGEFIGSINITAGQRFSDLGIGFNILNSTEVDQQDGPAGTQGFGVFFNAVGGGNGTAYQPIFFGYDDDGNDQDDNHDDMIVSAVFIPEPASASLLALGGLALIRRRRG